MAQKRVQITFFLLIYFIAVRVRDGNGNPFVEFTEQKIAVDSPAAGNAQKQNKPSILRDGLSNQQITKPTINIKYIFFAAVRIKILFLRLIN